MGRTKQTGRTDQKRMFIGTSSDDCLQLRAVTDADSSLLANGLGYGVEETLHTGKLKRSVVLDIYNTEVTSMDSHEEITEIACKFNVPYEKVLAIKNGELYSKYTTDARAMNSEVTIEDLRDSLDNVYKENEELDLENDGLRIIYDELQVEKDELQVEKDELEEEKDELHVEKMELEDENGDLEMENYSLRMTNDDLKVQLKYQRRILNARIERLQTLLRVAKEELELSEVTTKGLSDEIHAIRKSIYDGFRDISGELVQ